MAPAELKKRTRSGCKEERLARNVKIIIRWYTSSVRVVRESGRGIFFGRGGTFLQFVADKYVHVYVHAAVIFCEYAGRILQGMQPRIPGGFIGFYSLFGTDAYCCARFAPRMNQTRMENETWKRGRVGGRAEIDLLGLNKGLNSYAEKFFEKLWKKCFRTKVWVIYFSVRTVIK